MKKINQYVFIYNNEDNIEYVDDVSRHLIVLVQTSHTSAKELLLRDNLAIIA